MSGEIHICQLASPPTDDHECGEAIASEGRGCKRCNLDCYRHGWDKKRADADNRRRVTLKHEKG